MNTTVLVRKLGDTDTFITPIGLGTWQFSKQKNLAGKFWKTLNDEEIKSIVNRAITEGINWFDTAEAYGDGESERSLTKALNELNIKTNEVFIATKWMPIFRFAGSLKSSIGRRLENLNGFPITLYQIHNPMSFSSIKSEMKAMAELVRDLKIKLTVKLKKTEPLI
jgi:aryl-alcohol dehydrogenase-like predicted oxidoreductase